MPTIITDSGVDDILALYFLHKLKPELKVNLISTYGNVDENTAYKNLEYFLNISGINWSLSRGSKNPVNIEYNKLNIPYFYGKDGFCGVKRIKTNNDLDKSDFVNSQTIISLAPITVLDKLYDKNYHKEIIIMAGCFYDKNIEYNIKLDAQSAKFFFEKNKNSEIKIVSSEICEEVYWNRDNLKNYTQNSLIHEWLYEMVIKYINLYSKTKKFILYDPLAIYLYIFPQMAKWENGSVIVDNDGKTIFTKTESRTKRVKKLKNSKEISKHIFDIIFS